MPLLTGQSSTLAVLLRRTRTWSNGNVDGESGARREMSPVPCVGLFSIFRISSLDDGSCGYKIQLNSRTVTFDQFRRETILFNQHFKGLVDDYKKLMKGSEGTKLLFRCANPGMELLRGKAEAECRGGKWTSPSPYCLPLDPEDPRDCPPIHYIVEGGPFSTSPAGELVVSRSSTVSFFCLRPRNSGVPRWVCWSAYTLI